MSSPPRVVRLKRRAGVVVQDCDVYIGRMCTLGGWMLQASKWANPYSVKSVGSAERAVELYRTYLRGNSELWTALEELEGKTLGCWCKPGPCHGDVLVEMFNEKMDAK